MASLGTLAVNIVARTEKFTAGITKSISTMGKLNKGISTSTKYIGGFIAAAGAYASVSAIKGMVDDMSDLVDQSKALGTTTESLMGLQHAATLGGVSTNKLNTSLQKLVVNISKASAEGKGTVVDALAELGLNADRLNNLKPEQQMGVIADALKTVGNDADKARLAYTIFGKAGVSLLPMLADGSGGLRRMAKEAESLGIVFSSEQVGNVEAFGDALDNLSTSLGQLGQGLLIDVAPAAIKTTEALIEAVRGLQGLRGGDGRTDGSLLAPPDATGTDYRDSIKDGWWATGDQKRWAYDSTYNALANDKGGMLSAAEQAAADKRTAASVAMGEVGNEARADSLAIGANQGEAIGNISKRFGTMLGGAISTSNMQSLLKPVASGMATSFTAVSKKIAADADLMKRAQEVSDSLMTPAESVAKQMAEIDTLVAGGALDAARGAELKKRLGEDTAATAGPRQELTARTAGDIDTYAAARRNLGDGTKTQIDIAKKQLKVSSETKKLLARQQPQVFTLSWVT